MKEQINNPYNPDLYGAVIKVPNYMLLAMSSSSPFEKRFQKNSFLKIKISDQKEFLERYSDLKIAENLNELHDACAKLSKILNRKIKSNFFRKSWDAPEEEWEKEEDEIRKKIATLNDEIENSLQRAIEQEKARTSGKSIEKTIRKLKTIIEGKIRSLREEELPGFVMGDGRKKVIAPSKTDIRVYFILKILGESTPLNIEKIREFWIKHKYCDGDTMSISAQAIRNSIKRLVKFGYISTIETDKKKTEIVFNESQMYDTAKQGGRGFTCLTVQTLLDIMSCKHTDTLRLLLRIIYEVSRDMYAKRERDFKREGAEPIHTFTLKDSLRRVHLSHKSTIKKTMKEINSLHFGDVRLNDSGEFVIEIHREKLPRNNEFQSVITDSSKVERVIRSAYEEVQQDVKNRTSFFENGYLNFRSYLAKIENGSLQLTEHRDFSLVPTLERIYNNVGIAELKEVILTFFQRYGRDLKTLKHDRQDVFFYEQARDDGKEEWQMSPEAMVQKHRFYELKEQFDSLCANLYVIATNAKTARIMSS